MELEYNAFTDILNKYARSNIKNAVSKENIANIENAYDNKEDYSMSDIGRFEISDIVDSVRFELASTSSIAIKTDTTPLEYFGAIIYPFTLNEAIEYMEICKEEFNDNSDFFKRILLKNGNLHDETIVWLKLN